MREAHPDEQAVGVDWYVSDADGVGGRLKTTAADFRVRELEAFDVEPLDADPGSYPHVVFRAELKNWDTNDFADAMSKKLGISRERVSWAGTKDKRAVTTQLFSVKGVAPEDVPTVDEADVEVLGRAGRPVLFGDLAGNAFEVIVREADHPEHADAVTDALRDFSGTTEKIGVPNFFGPQRFGSQRPVTHATGLDIVRGEWEEAVKTYVCTRTDAEREDSYRVREELDDRWGERAWSEFVERLPGRLRYERSLLSALAENGGTEPDHFREALERFPTNLQSMLVNAVQSYAYNRMLSERLERGLPFHEAVAGDVVCFADRDAPEGLELPDTSRLQRVDEGRVDTVNRHLERGRAFVTVPLVGTESELGDGEVGDIERAVLDDMDLAPEDFDLPGAFHSTGTRRAILVRTEMGVARNPLTFSFALPKGSYATTILREYLKTAPTDLT
ncbi:tRNA pseudouridine(13) synthase TruD [Halorarius litoreus]|uniref:tRNA pseudouridine(13) synthase TruD n=1 Tax=Halorarius litoreus TaxID=2962676 RepID=UPI0020CCBC21|nr:tRNA pseudouridine(13) synthase TruD [Halorarius litoreus]